MRHNIRSFVRREGRLTKRQENALVELLPKFGLNYQSEPYELVNIYGREAPLTVEIGFGMGQSLVEMASAQPQWNFLGIEVYRPGLGTCLADIADLGLNNLRVIQYDAVEVLKNSLSPESVDRLQLFFPDPWHKKRHHKRRIVQLEFAALVLSRLKRTGVFHMTTDWQNYAEHALEVISETEGYRNLSTQGNYVSRPVWRPITKFECRAQALGNCVWELMFERSDQLTISN